MAKPQKPRSDPALSEATSRIGHAATDGLPGIIEDTAAQGHQEDSPAHKKKCHVCWLGYMTFNGY